MRPNEWWGEGTTYEPVALAAVRCTVCRARLPVGGQYAVRVDGHRIVANGAATCPRCRHPQPMPRTLTAAQLSQFLSEHCGNPFAGPTLNDAEVNLALPRRDRPAPDS